MCNLRYRDLFEFYTLNENIFHPKELYKPILWYWRKCMILNPKQYTSGLPCNILFSTIYNLQLSRLAKNDPYIQLRENSTCYRVFAGVNTVKMQNSTHLVLYHNKIRKKNLITNHHDHRLLLMYRYQTIGPNRFPFVKYPV